MEEREIEEKIKYWVNLARTTFDEQEARKINLRLRELGDKYYETAGRYYTS